MFSMKNDYLFWAFSIEKNNGVTNTKIWGNARNILFVLSSSLLRQSLRKTSKNSFKLVENSYKYQLLYKSMFIIRTYLLNMFKINFKKFRRIWSFYAYGSYMRTDSEIYCITDNQLAWNFKYTLKIKEWIWIFRKVL